ncbi:uncharacterized protein TNCV_1344741 [Trichonephila clavipes]|nr:uncharacterized protein TNCV_1344741 [Trichonephila clavipes]
MPPDRQRPDQGPRNSSWQREGEYPGGGQRPPISLPFPPTSREDLRLDGDLKYPHAATALYIYKDPCHLRDSNPVPAAQQSVSLTTIPDGRQGDNSWDLILKLPRLRLRPLENPRTEALNKVIKKKENRDLPQKMPTCQSQHTLLVITRSSNTPLYGNKRVVDNEPCSFKPQSREGELVCHSPNVPTRPKFIICQPLHEFSGTRTQADASSRPVPLKTRRVWQRCTLNLSRAEASSRWCGVVVRRGGASSGVVHVT